MWKAREWPDASPEEHMSSKLRPKKCLSDYGTLKSFIHPVTISGVAESAEE